MNQNNETKHPIILFIIIVMFINVTDIIVDMVYSYIIMSETVVYMNPIKNKLIQFCVIIVPLSVFHILKGFCEGFLGNKTKTDKGEEKAIELFSPHGDPIRTISIPDISTRRGHSDRNRLAYDGNRIVIAGESELEILSAEGELIQKSRIPQSDMTPGYWSVFILDGGRELRLADLKTGRIFRYEIKNY